CPRRITDTWGKVVSSQLKQRRPIDLRKLDLEHHLAFVSKGHLNRVDHLTGVSSRHLAQVFDDMGIRGGSRQYQSASVSLDVQLLVRIGSLNRAPQSCNVQVHQNIQNLPSPRLVPKNQAAGAR